MNISLCLSMHRNNIFRISISAKLNPNMLLNSLVVTNKRIRNTIQGAVQIFIVICKLPLMLKMLNVNMLMLFKATFVYNTMKRNEAATYSQ